MVGLIVAAVLALAGLAAYTLWKSKKAVTGASVIAESEALVKSEASKVANTAETAVANTVAKVV